IRRFALGDSQNATIVHRSATNRGAHRETNRRSADDQLRLAAPMRRPAANRCIDRRAHSRDGGKTLRRTLKKLKMLQRSNGGSCGRLAMLQTPAQPLTANFTM